MLITPHVVLGAAIATKTNNPFLIFPLSFLSHYLLDIIPHWQETLYPYKPSKKTWARLSIDLFIAVLLVNLISSRHSSYSSLIWLSAFISNVADLDVIISFWKRSFKLPIFAFYYNYHYKIQRETSSLLGLIPQVIIVLLSLIISF